MRLGAAGYMLKPVDPDQIVSRVRTILQEQTRQVRRQRIFTEIKGILAELNEMER
jgi:DNA-binding NarL/FixJ family response regulator